MSDYHERRLAAEWDYVPVFHGRNGKGFKIVAILYDEDGKEQLTTLGEFRYEMIAAEMVYEHNKLRKAKIA